MGQVSREQDCLRTIALAPSLLDAIRGSVDCPRQSAGSLEYARAEVALHRGSIGLQRRNRVGAVVLQIDVMSDGLGFAQSRPQNFIGRHGIFLQFTLVRFQSVLER